MIPYAFLRQLESVLRVDIADLRDDSHYRRLWCGEVLAFTVTVKRHFNANLAARNTRSALLTARSKAGVEDWPGVEQALQTAVKHAWTWANGLESEVQNVAA